jgi:hypothetical protein
MVRVVPLVLAVVAVIALGAAAATIDTATDEGVAGEGEGEGFGSPGFSLGTINDTAADGGTSVIPDWLVRVLTVALFGLGIVGFAMYVYEEGLTGVAKIAMAAVLLAAIVAGLFQLLQNFQLPDDGQGGLIGGGDPALGTGGGGGGDLSPTVLQEPAFLTFVVLGALAVGAVVVLARSTGSTTAPTPGATAEPDPSVAAVGEAAGRAADRIEADAGADVENAVYHAWREMTDYLDLPRATTTPGEFADAAVEAGMGREDVRELTDVFEAVRYGGAAPDPDREERAVDALRRIETTYADADVDADATESSVGTDRDADRSQKR